MYFFQDYILHQWLIIGALAIVFLAISRWALVTLREYAGYGLGWMLGLFFVIVYVSIGGGYNPDPEAPRYLDIFQVVIATFLGLLFGGLIQLGMRFGMRIAQGVALQVAFYTSLSLIVLFLVTIEGPIAQRMIGIFGLSVAIATLFAMVLFPSPKREQQLQAISYSQPIAPVQQTQQMPQVQTPQQFPPQNLGQGGGNGNTRLDEIRQRLKHEQGRR